MSFFRKHIYLSVFLGVILLGTTAILLGWYPVLIVGHTPVFEHTLSKTEDAYRFAYQKASPLYASSTMAIPLPNDETLTVGTLTALIEETLIHERLSQEYDVTTLAGLLHDKLGKYESDTRLAAATKSLYGLSFADFESIFLIPQAERDLLTSKLFLEGTQFSDWLSNAKKNVSIKIFFPGYSWDGNTVVYGK